MSRRQMVSGIGRAKKGWAEEFVPKSITEQKQVGEGAAHAFYRER